MDCWTEQKAGMRALQSLLGDEEGEALAGAAGLHELGHGERMRMVTALLQRGSELGAAIREQNFAFQHHGIAGEPLRFFGLDFQQLGQPMP